MLVKEVGKLIWGQELILTTQHSIEVPEDVPGEVDVQHLKNTFSWASPVSDFVQLQP